MTVTLPNPNKPLMAFDVNFQTGPPNPTGGARVSINSPSARCFVRQWDVVRGRQYELNQVQAGAATLNVVDPLENLNPLNATSPYNTGGNTIAPYRAIGLYCYWPTVGNVFNPMVNPGFDPSFENGTSGFVASGGTTLARSTAQAFVGTHSLLVTQGGNTSAAWPSVVIPGVPGMTATISVYAYLTGGSSLQIQCPDGTVSSVLSTQTTWTRVTVAYAQVNAQERTVLAGTGTATPTFYLDAFQVEWAASASAFTTTGPTRYQIFNGYVERYPTSYDMAGTRARHPLQAVDALAMLSRTNISQSYDATVTADVPRWYAPLDNTTVPVQGQVGGVNTDNWIPYNLPNSPYGAVQWGSDTNLDGTSAVVVSQRNPTNPVSSAGNVPNNRTVLEFKGSPLSVSTIGATFEGWFKPVAGGMELMQFCEGFDASSLTPAPGSSILVGNLVNVQSTFAFALFDQVTSGFEFVTVNSVNPAVSNFADGKWHYYAVTLTNVSGSPGLTLTVDGTEIAVASPFGSARNIGFPIVETDAYSGYGDPVAQMSAARIAAYASDIGRARRLAHYRRGVGYVNELSGVRVRRLLDQYWGGVTKTADGYLKMAPDFAYNTRTLLDVIQEIQESERGLVYVDRNGTVVFEDRSSRYQNQVPVAVFGENPSGASSTEYPYVQYSADLDPTYVFTQANLTRPDNSNFPPRVNATSQAKYGQRILTQTLQTNTDFDLGQAATFYLHRYADPKVRISVLTLNPAANPALWPVVLGLEISQRVTVKRRTAALTTSNDYYVEQIHHKADAETGEWTVELQLSPVFVPSVWVLGDHTYGKLGTGTACVY
jgi:hypothetical protein